LKESKNSREKETSERWGKTQTEWAIVTRDFAIGTAALERDATNTTEVLIVLVVDHGVGSLMVVRHRQGVR
jgi:hypothetical protein